MIDEMYVRLLLAKKKIRFLGIVTSEIRFNTNVDMSYWGNDNKECQWTRCHEFVNMCTHHICTYINLYIDT